MSNPSLVDIYKGSWKKVATGVTTGTIHRISKTPRAYYQTYRETGETAPTDTKEGALMFSAYPDEEQISSSSSIDVYVTCARKNGKVRVDV